VQSVQEQPSQQQAQAPSPQHPLFAFSLETPKPPSAKAVKATENNLNM
jgi:hypothetical protein